MNFILSEHKALGTLWWIEVFSELTSEQMLTIKSDLIVSISQFENNYSRFKSDSVLSELNTKKVINNPSPEFVKLLKTGQNLFNETEGKFNILIGDELIARGYDADYSFKLKPSPNYTPNPLSDLIISDTKILLNTGSIDLGGYGKGYLIDILAEKLKNDFGLKAFLINGGGDIYVASQDNEPITIHLEHPTKPNTYIGETTLKNEGFAASSPHKRSWKIKNKTYHHIVAKDEEIIIDGTFVKAKTVAKADAFATVCLMLNPNQIKNFAKKNNLKIASFNLDSSKLTLSNGF